VPDLTATCRGEGAHERKFTTEELTWCPRTLPLAIELALIRGLGCRMASCLLSSRALKLLGPIYSMSLDTRKPDAVSESLCTQDTRKVGE
jgi:hypothetical protein